MNLYSVSQALNDTHNMKLDIFRQEDLEELVSLPLFLNKVPAGFPSPAEDYIEQKLNVQELLVKRPASTFFIRVSGYSMLDAGIHDGDILVVDRSLKASNQKIIVAILDGELTIKRFEQSENTIYLHPENSEYQSITVTPDMDFEVWGVVTNVIHAV